MNFRKNKNIQTITLVLVVVGLLLLALSGSLTSFGEGLLSPILSVQQWLTGQYQTIQDFVNAPTDMARLRQRNAELEAEVANLQTQVITLQQQVTEVELLSSLLDFARGQRENEYIAASVIYLDPRPFLKYVVIDVGSDDGVLAGMPVVSAEGLVGRVAAVSSNAARVQLITDTDSNVNVLIQPSDTTAVSQGSTTGDITLQLISKDANVAAGDLILTSGLGGNYPGNILVGQVANVRSSATALFQEAAVQPAVDFSRLDIVLVIIDYQPVDIELLLPEDTEIE